MTSFLDEVLSRLERAGVLAVLVEVIRDVYRVNADRYEPGPAVGDDSSVFGITVSRNIANRAVAALRGRAGVEARLVNNALQITCQGMVLRQYKLSGSGLNVSVESIDWTTSEAKLRGPIENSQTDDQLSFDADPDMKGAFDKAIPAFRHIRIVHSGSPESGHSTISAGIPRDHREGGSPWIDVRCIWSDADGAAGGWPNSGGTVSPGPARPAPPGPAHSDLPPHDPPVMPRRERRTDHGDSQATADPTSS